uniref:Class I SAM-dependent methyltransferase n=1 Tax=candidate division WOR-3 bacterium TaxID=2052148 RepID=A0A7C4YFZ9_UNCW3
MKGKMKEFKEHYEFYDFLYNPFSKAGLERKERMKNIITKYCKKSSGNALDLCCGMGIGTFTLEEIGFDVIGVDIKEDYIKRAKIYAKKLNSNTKFFIQDTEDLSFQDNTFDIITMLGNAMPHFSIDSFSKSMKESYRVLKEGGEIIIQYTDWISIIFSFYQRTLIEDNDKGEVMISYHSGLNTKEGFIKRFFHIPGKGKKFENIFYIWSPWILEYVLKENGFKNIESFNESGVNWITKGKK